jgi:type II secretory pathway component PulJ
MNKRLLSFYHLLRSSQSGFTVAELLIGSAIGAILITSMMYLVTEMTRTERTQTARGETEREMAQSLDYIASELRQAVFVYDRGCLRNDGRGEGPSCPNLKLPRNTVLAFWRREEAPNGITNLVAYSSYCRSLAGIPADDCKAVTDYVRTQYTLVTYALCPNRFNPTDCSTTTAPRGPGRIIRRFYRQYQFQSGSGANEFINRFRSAGGDYIDPLANPINWPGNGSGQVVNQPGFGGTTTNSDSAVLVTNVDWEGAAAGVRVPVDCPANYVASTGDGDLANAAGNVGFRSFYACIRRVIRPTGGTDDRTFKSGFVQDVFVYLRGNAADRAGLRDIESTGTNIYRPSVETQIRTRGSFDRVP